MPERLLYDALEGFSGGVNSDLEPVLLDRNTAAWASNATFRGGFARPRAPIFNRAITFPSDEVRTAVTQGLFQGAGYYRPDFGYSQLVAQISGRLFAFQVIGNNLTCSEVTVPGSPNDPTVSQVWMFQAEKWLIVTDGTTALPIFYDGVISRRSYGPSVVLGVATAFDPVSPPAIGEIVKLTLNDPYTGPFNVPVLFNGEYYQPTTSASAGYEAILKNAFGSPSTTLNQGEVVTVIPQPVTTNVQVTASSDFQAAQVFVGTPFTPSGSICQQIAPIDTTVRTDYGYWTIPVGTIVSLTLSAPLPSPPSNIRLTLRQLIDTDNCSPSTGLNSFPGFIQIKSSNWEVVSTAGNVLQIRSTGFSAYPEFISVRSSSSPSGYYFNQQVYNSTRVSIQIGQSISSTTPQDPPYPVGKLMEDYASPPSGGTISIFLDTLYTGAANQKVTIEGLDFELSPGPTPDPSTTLYLINLTDQPQDPPVPYVNPSDVLSVPELPAGRMGAYGLNHVALCLTTGYSYIYGDVNGGPSGTPAYDYRDAVLKTTENDFLAGGGSFRIPNTGEIISSFTIAPVLDASYGQGPLQIGTPVSVFTCAIPTTPDAFEALTNPILTEALIGKGPVSQNGTLVANSDTLYRSVLGFDSLIYGRRDFATSWGNTPISTEVNRSIEGENKSLISFTSAATFDNRLLATVQLATSGRGIYSNGVVALNFDPVSSLRGKAPSIWEGQWEGGNVLQYVVGNFSGVERCFQFTYNPTTLQIEIWEQLRSDSTEVFDNGTERITWSIETPCIFKPENRAADLPIVRLANGKMHLDQVVGRVDVTVQYRPDYSATWVDWHSFTVNSTIPDGYKTPIGLGEPRVNSCAPENNRPNRSGRFFQLKFIVTGQAKIMGFEAAACQEPTVLFPPPICT